MRTTSLSRALIGGVTALTVTAGSLVAVVGPAHGKPPGSAGPVRPTPQEMRTRSDGFPITPVVGLVRAEDGDRYAERVVREVLERAGVMRIVTTSGRDPGTPVTVWLGDGDAVLTGLGVEDADSLAAEGYVLGAGRDADERGHVVLDGVDADGTFYAAHTLRQLVQPRPGMDWMPGVEVRDWPAMRYRGLIEGFYGTPWSHLDRLRLMDFLGAHKMNTFEYAPKDDPFHRERWRDPYPADKLAELKELVDRGRANHVDFDFALSPGLSICYTSEDDFQKLVAKFEALYDVGTRHFNIPLDDINYNVWHCDSDRERFGTGGGAAGEAQAFLLNRVQREWVEPKGDVAPLQMVPTEYYDASETPYKRALREELDETVIVMWTGIGVIPQSITVAQAQQAREVFGHEIIVWDNYPVNDYIAGRLPLAPFTGRENGLSRPLAGIVSNPMNQAAVSEIALSSFGDFGWNDAEYDARRSWEAATAEAAGGDPDVAAALRTFADLNWFDGTLHHEQSPVLARHVAEFWEVWQAGRPVEATAGLRAVLIDYRDAPDVIRDRLPDEDFVAQAAAWLDAAELWTNAMLGTVDMLEAQARGDGDAAWAARRRVDALVTQAKAIRDVRVPHSTTYPRIGDGVVDAFVDDGLATHDRWVGVRTSAPDPTTTMGTWADNVAGRMVDGDPETFYWSNRAPGPGDAVGVDFGAPREIGQIEVLMAKPSSPNDYIHSGVLEYSVDGTTWHALINGSTPDVRTTAPEGTTARYVRYRSTSDNDGNWLVVREFTVEILDDEVTTYRVTGAPPAASESSLAAAADGRLGTSYVGGRPAEPGEALVVTASRARPVDRVIVLQSGEPVPATLQLHDQRGAWVDAGVVTDAYTEVDVDAVTSDAFRLVWQGHQRAPQVAEVVPRYADVPVADLTVDPRSLEIERGDTATLDVVLSSTRAEAVTGRLTVDAPASWTVEPREAVVTVPRGEARTVDVKITVPDDAPLGDVDVVVTFAVGSDQVVRTVDARVYPATSNENAALRGIATASSVEQNLDRLRPEHVNDGDLSTRWASGYEDDEWVQVELPEAEHIGKVVLRWEAAFGKDYDVQMSDDGQQWRTLASVRGGDGGVDTIRVDATGRFIRMHGVDRATEWGYSLWEFELYPVDN